MTENGAKRSSVELRPCPFCGSEPEIGSEPKFCVNPTKAVIPYSFFVRCVNYDACDAIPMVRYFSTEEQAVKSWNTRAERTCTVEEWIEDCISDSLSGAIAYSAKLSCGHSSEIVITFCCEPSDDLLHGRFCPECGAKVVAE